MDLRQQIVIILGVFFAVWYGVFWVLNRRRGIATYHWLRGALTDKIGDVTGANWLGSSASGARLVVGKAKSPFKQVEVTFLLEAREILPLWAFHLLRGKRAELIVKASLRSLPKLEMEAARKGLRRLESLTAEDGKRPYEWVPTIRGLKIVQRGRKNPGVIERRAAFLDRYGEAVQQISLRRKIPHVMLRIALSSFADEPAEDFFTALKAWLSSDDDDGA